MNVEFCTTYNVQLVKLCIREAVLKPGPNIAGLSEIQLLGANTNIKLQHKKETSFLTQNRVGMGAGERGEGSLLGNAISSSLF